MGLGFIEGCTAVIADFLDVIPQLTSAEARTALVRCVLMWALRLKQEFSEGIQVNPLGSITAAFAYRAGYVASVFVTVAVLGFAYRHVSLAVAVHAVNKDLNFDHHWLLSGALNKKSRPRL
jgi:hypothetical protein